MTDVTGVGTVVTIRASKTFPAGFPVTQFADDGDSIAFDDMEIAGSAMGMNGDLITWAKASAIPLTLNIIPHSEDDVNMSILFEANRAGKGKIPVQDIITATIVYPNGRVTVLAGGRLVKGKPTHGITAEGRMVSKPYSFVFENKSAT